MGHSSCSSLFRSSSSSLNAAILLLACITALFILLSQPSPRCQIILTGESISILNCENIPEILRSLPTQPLVVPLSCDHQ
uniref:Movement protein TGBp3 n=1 Tax=Yucca alphaflexivirus 1 TaxID=2794423 RepID=A0A7T5UGJ2_9VIRU|nr:TGB3 [Yucca alphaflexivirus 1]